MSNLRLSKSIRSNLLCYLNFRHSLRIHFHERIVPKQFIGTISISARQFNGFSPIRYRACLPTLVQYRHNSSTTGPLDSVSFEPVCDETLESLCEYFEEIVESCSHLDSADVTYGDGVLTVQFGKPYGTYVINRQTPNLQIWLSSPTSGPKRYDFQNGKWIYKHDGLSLHELLNKEVAEIVKQQVDFSCCSYSGGN